MNAPFTHYTHWSSKVTEHLRQDYHVDAAVKAETFITAMCNPKKELIVQLDSSIQRQIDSNRCILILVTESIIFLARCGIPLWGHRDSGRISCPATSSDIKVDKGSFRTLQFKAASGNQTLALHLESASGNALYISLTIQSEIISIIGNIILHQTVEEINYTGYFSVLADKQQMLPGTVVIQYVFSGEMWEQFIRFTRANDLTGSGVA